MKPRRVKPCFKPLFHVEQFSGIKKGMDILLVESQIENIVTMEVGHNDWQHGSTWQEIGLDSIDIVLVFSGVEKCFDMKPINQDKMEDIDTPGKLIKFVKDNL